MLNVLCIMLNVEWGCLLDVVLNLPLRTFNIHIERVYSQRNFMLNILHNCNQSIKHLT